ncbi:PREDICTED: phosphatidylinositide phosphatase SAC2 isoform X2 [Ceratosolen solmsi marchali]|uniref:Phosphatidylinositide phosphatase SAC2 isoform X2 n=1 Tax=Ceratosolen solmsi marchali TaxID=326594 RepID=A0AAJ6YFD9_9HYME|nr:PREDICTED: phosphatidylinositide phosphatase SAC2 isoform X2 [Ceratosolen solmsi marchali]
MELFRSDKHFIFVKENYSLWWDKQTGKFSAESDWEWANANDLECIGLFYGIIGKIDQANVLQTRLVLIKEITAVGELQGGHAVYKIKSVAFLHLGSENFDIDLFPCSKHQNVHKNKQISSGLFDTQKTSFVKTWDTIKNATNTIKNTTQQAAALATSQVKLTVMKKTETDSFFFCETRDITNSLQRLCEQQNQKDEKNQNWRIVDDRFFWNKFMLQDIINLNTEKADCWILPIIQGYIQIEKCQVEVGYDRQPLYEIFNLAIISRRSKFRAGTRYKRRGVDENGKCANYVETEQLIWYNDHQVSFVQVRGSVPIYWSQRGYKYKPPPRIDRDKTETKVAFEKHFTEELNCYGPICIVNLIEQNGKESIIWEAYSNHILNYNHEEITYTTFDFHEYCRGMHFENVSLLVSSLAIVLSEMGYCWHDKQGTICMQKGAFRVNCIDCLDRTNVVQTALGKAMMEIQFSKLGLIPPDGSLPTNIRQTFQLLWANNGDIISKQYAGTNALKGDYTRTGERKFTGLMKDGMNSANRYYLNRFKDVYRQATIDMMLGNLVSDELFYERTEEEDNVSTAIHVKLLIEDCKKLLIPNSELILNCWGLIDADPITGDSTETEMDSILILTHDSYYVADYDEQIDKVTNYQRVLLKDIVLIECGQIENTVCLFKNKNHYCIRINYKINDDCGYFHMFRSTNLRFFNNMAIVIKTDEERIESLKAIVEAIYVAMEIASLPKILTIKNAVLDKRKSKTVDIKTHAGLLDISSFPAITKNISETQLNALKSVGTKALSNMSEQFSKLNKLSQSLATKRPMELTKNSTKSEIIHNIKPIFMSSKYKLSATVHKSDSGTNNSNSSNCVEIEKEKKNIFYYNKNLMEGYIPSIGIIMGVQNNNIDKVSKESMVKGQLNMPVSNLEINIINYEKNVRGMPEITIQNIVENFSNVSNKNFISSLNLSKNISHSSDEVNSHYIFTNATLSQNNILKTTNIGILQHRPSSEQDLILSMSTSQSESALKSIKSNVGNTSLPTAATAKDILSPFSKLAKGVQIFGANLDLRKLKSTGQVGMAEIAKDLTDHHSAEMHKLQKKWVKCKSRLIAL